MASNNNEFQLGNVFNVQGKVAVVTGGGSGIGLMAAQALAVNGARVYIVGRTESKLLAAVAAHGGDRLASLSTGGELIPIVADVSDKQSIAKLVADVSARERRLDVLVNCAGIFTAGQITPPPGSGAPAVRAALFDHPSATFEDWTAVYRTNAASPYFVTTGFLALLDPAVTAATESGTGEEYESKDRGVGYTSCVINITSINGMVRRSLGHPAAGAAKAAANHVTTLLAAEVAEAGLAIRVNAVAPGVFPSEITAGVPSDAANGNKSVLPDGGWGTSEILAGRLGNDVDMAGAILFAATNQYLHGQVICVDGGYLAKHGKL